MLYFQISGYKNKIKQFPTLNAALYYIKSHPTILRREYQFAVNAQSNPQSEEKGIYIYKGKPNSIVCKKKTDKSNKVLYRICNASLDKIGLTLQSNSFVDIFDTCLNERHCIKNKILLSFWETNFVRNFNANGSSVKTLKDLFELVLSALNNNVPISRTLVSRPVFGQSNKIQNFKYENIDGSFYPIRFNINGQDYTLYCSKYRMQSSPQNSLTDFKNPKVVCVLDVKTGKPVQVKASKILLDCIKSNQCYIGEQTTIYCAEEFQSMWESYVSKMTEGLHIKVSNDIKSIYTSSNFAGPINSCMNDKGQYVFYEKNLNASAAALLNEDNKILCRCIIFNNVRLIHDSSRTYNYAERQYPINGNIVFSKILIQKLIDEGYIDLYKIIGAGVSDCLKILDKEGKQLEHPEMEIDCKIEFGDILSYQDTFKYYYPEDRIAKNILTSRIVRELGHTSRIYSYHD